MNREIKFRAYCNIDKKMYPYALIGQNGALDVHVDEVHVGRWKNIGCGREDGEVDYSFELMQFTGLKDMNGKEIYEGDIVDLFPEASDFKKGYAIVFEEGEFRVDVRAPMNRRISQFANKVKVVGNLFENTELLK